MKVGEGKKHLTLVSSQGAVQIDAAPQLRASDAEPGSYVAQRAEFDDAARKNAENAERLRRERLAANKSVLRSYRIKS